jgi:hypothetical protein
MKLLVVYARIYGQSVMNAVAAIAKNSWTLLLPMGLVVAWTLLAGLLGSIGVAGGILAGLARSAALSIYSFFLGGLVAQQKVGVDQLRKSVGVYFWSWFNIFFVLWVVDLVLGAVFTANPALKIAFDLVLLIALNTTPEVVYQKGTRGGLETIQRSFLFLQENWVEWFIPNGLVLGGVFAIFSTGALVGVFRGPLAIAAPLLGGVLLHVYMVFRGFLFEALDGSTHRQRMFRYRNAQ